MKFDLKALIFLPAFMPSAILAQKTAVPMAAAHWEVKATEHRFENYKGRQSLYLKRGEAILKNGRLKNGIIDYEVTFDNSRNFAGIHFRRLDENNSEDFYLRPHQSGNPDASQYTPIVNGLAGWQLYFGEGYAVPVVFRFGEWMHVRLVINGSRMEVYLDDMEKPFLHVFDMKQAVIEGGIAFWAGIGPAWFANLTYEPVENPPLKNDPVKTVPPDASTIQKWQVSNPFDEALVDGRTTLDKDLKNKLQWGEMGVEYTGLANLSRVAVIGEKETTVIAKFTIISDQQQIKRLDFGFSDRVRVYCNDQVLFMGNDPFQSRDYRFLGSIGYFDSVFLPLRKGKNEIWMAVSENFGGWGVKARLEDLEGVRME